MSFRFHEAKFLIVAAAGNARGLLVRPKKPKEKLGITVGQELPRRGRCSHYGKSYRWFRYAPRRIHRTVDATLTGDQIQLLCEDATTPLQNTRMNTPIE
ncbi:MAG: hypothetical protein M1815_001827 [Lichina confinis]|nr:MAG: hypothetical protein M1815_001827 [Lichina confinis]